MTLKIDNAIEEIERALAGNKPKYANDIYLKNAIRYLQEIKSPSLTDDQQVVLEWLKEEYKRTKWSSPFGTVYSTINIHEMFVRMRLTKAQQFQVLAAFAEWGSKEDNQ